MFTGCSQDSLPSLPILPADDNVYIEYLDQNEFDYSQNQDEDEETEYELASEEQSLTPVESSEQPNRKRPFNKETVVYLINDGQNPNPITSTSSTLTELANSDCGLNSSFLSFVGNISDCNLLNILEADAIGKAILKKYDNCKTLNSRERNNLCEIIVTYFLNKSCKLTNEALSVIADKLILIFQTEKKATYFVDAIPKKRSRLNRPEIAKGKLVDKHRNKLTAIRRAQQFEAIRAPSPDVQNEEITQSAIDSKIWLQTNREPVNDILHHWKNSFSIRKNSIQRQENLTAFLSEWSILENQIAIELFDFTQTYTEHQPIENLEQRFDDFFNILEKRRSRLSGTDQTLLDLLNDETLTTEIDNANKNDVLVQNDSNTPSAPETTSNKRQTKLDLTN
ncbi:unnamed protein product [Brassicogethes aeneus]|uniref:Uncharacterized protein n=1 Tax=Brassicogethes aeneus TaxID=1431903 RepID=A0A9P0FNH5_BRAAE|nr:unnamed protein product [Brassicogethes aeneus]